MKKISIIALAAIAAISSCTKDIVLPGKEVPEVSTPEIPAMVFTATMEGTLSSKATFDADARCASWEMNDVIKVNGCKFISMNAGKSASFCKVVTKQIRPSFVSSTSGGFDGEGPSNLVDESGTHSKWCANEEHRENDAWDIIVSTDTPSSLIGLVLYNCQDTQTYPERRWKSIRISGASSADGPWEELRFFHDLNLPSNIIINRIDVDIAKRFQFYKVEILSAAGGDIIQMSDMQFDVLDYSKTQEVAPGPYSAYFPAKLYNSNTASLPSEINETWKEGRFDMPMYAYSTDTDLEFKNLCGVLKISVSSDKMAKVKSIMVSSSNLAVSGAFTVGEDNAAVLVKPSDSSKTLTITYNDAVSTDTDGKVFYIPLPAQTYRDLKILVSDGEKSEYMVSKPDTDITVERNKIYPISFSPRYFFATINDMIVNIDAGESFN